MPSRENTIASSIQYSILHAHNKLPSFLSRIPAYFYLYWLSFSCLQSDLFTALRGIWEIKEDDYRASFGARGKSKKQTVEEKEEARLKSLGDMGYSGSTFFRTPDSAYLIKSVPRYFEHSFFKDDMLRPYAEYMQSQPSSLLIHISDFLECAQHSIGAVFGLAPSHHLVMENLLYGQKSSTSTPSTNDDGGDEQWQSFDLKPMSYFYPERDIAGGALTSEATKSKLADDFSDKIYISRDDAETLEAQLQKDTKFLESCNAVDYSLFLVKIPASAYTPPPNQRESPWHDGIRGSAPDSEGKMWIYRAAILDFFWAKHKVHAKAMTGLIKTYNLVDRQGPMSVTTTADDYRERFLKMCKEIVEVR